jgi:signal transduction histidine kinase
MGVDAAVQVIEPLSDRTPQHAARSWRAELGWRNLPPASPDLLAGFAPMLSALRWATVCLGLALAWVEHLGPHVAVVGGVLVAYTVWRTLRPIGRERTNWHTTAALLLEVTVGVAVVELSGFSGSPFLVSLGVATLVAGFAGGLRVVSGLAVISGIAVALPTLLVGSHGGDAVASVQFAVELVLVGVVGGFSRYLVEDAHQARAGLADRVEHLSEVNDLLLDLHRATEHEVTPMHTEGAARWALERLEELLSPDIAAVVLLDPVTGSWQVTAAHGVRLTQDTPFTLPRGVAEAVLGTDTVVAEDLDQGLSYRSKWGMYCPMRTRDEIVGVLAVEGEERHRVSSQDRRRMGDLARAAALAVDNARWLERIHTLGMEQERSRLARELHDHIGQSVVHLGFELDRLVQLNHGQPVEQELLVLRGDLRDLVEELRDMLVDLRCDVSESQGVDGVLESFLDRVNKRNRVAVTLVADAEARMPIPVEREFWRVAREAVMNAERHGRASRVSVLWQCNTDGALLEVADDGIGLSAGKAVGASGYGLLGMRERADAVGAQLEITSGPGKGTVVRMRMRAA